MLMKYRKAIAYLNAYQQNLKKVILYVSKNNRNLNPELLVKPYVYMHKQGLLYEHKMMKLLHTHNLDSDYFKPFGYVDNYTDWDIFDELNSIDGLSYQYEEIQGDADEDIPVSVNMVTLRLDCDNGVSFKVNGSQLDVISNNYDNGAEKCTSRKESIGNFLGVLKTLNIVIGYKIKAIKLVDKEEDKCRTKRSNDKKSIENGKYSWNKIFN